MKKSLMLASLVAMSLMFVGCGSLCPKADCPKAKCEKVSKCVEKKECKDKAKECKDKAKDCKDKQECAEKKECKDK